MVFIAAESVVVEIRDGDQQSSDGTQTWPMRGHRRKPSRGPELPVLDKLPVSVVFDMRYTSVMALFSFMHLHCIIVLQYINILVFFSAVVSRNIWFRSL